VAAERMAQSKDRHKMEAGMPSLSPALSYPWTFDGPSEEAVL
jgi:hypothetical protein